MDVVKHPQGYYVVGTWTFDEDDADLGWIDEAITAWTAWRDFVVANHIPKGEYSE